MTDVIVDVVGLLGKAGWIRMNSCLYPIANS